MNADDPARAGAEPDSLDARRWTRDMAVLVALPAMWVDHDPAEIGSGLLGVLSGMLDLTAAYLRFDDGHGDPPLECWLPRETAARATLASMAIEGDGAVSGVAVEGLDGTAWLVRLPLALPWGTGVVAALAARPDFPTAVETHLLRVATGQAAIAMHTSRRLQQEHTARTAAEDALARHEALLRSLLDDVEPSLTRLATRIRDASSELHAQPEAPRASEVGNAPDAARGNALAPLSHREAEVLGLLAQGLSNKEIAGLLWLSDRTVERHITSLYRKIGVARRSEATAFALRHGIG